MAGVNKAILVGKLGKDPEVRFTQGGQPVCQFSLATNETWNDKQGQKQSRVEWHRIVVWGKTAEVCGEHLAKGSQVYLEGKLQTREWEKDGQKNKITEIVAHSVQFIGEKPDGNRNSPAPARERSSAHDLGYRLPGEDEDPF